MSVAFRLGGVLLLLLAAASGRADADADAAEPLRVLFIGNSYTYTNDLPEVVRRLAAKQGIALDVDALTLPGAAIEDHFDNGSLQREVARGWDWVLLQQGPSSLQESRQNLVRWSGRAAQEARRVGAKVALISVWPDLRNLGTWRRAEQSYRKAAIMAGGCMLPAAAAWRLARAETPVPDLYQSDQLHPRPIGTLLAGLAIVHGLFGGVEPTPIGDLNTLFPQSQWREALALLPRLDRHAREAVLLEEASCPPRPSA